jgi:hypothetical protein
MNPTDVRPFVATGQTVTIAATPASAANTLILPANTNRPGNPEMPQTCRVVNVGTGLCFIKFGISTDTALQTVDIPVAPNTTEVFWVPAGATHIITIAAAATTATVYATPGQGGG